jgi:hypothetical protein
MNIERQTNLNRLSLINVIVFILTIFLYVGSASAQNNENKLETSANNSFGNYKNLPLPDYPKVEARNFREIKQLQYVVPSFDKLETIDSELSAAELKNEKVIKKVVKKDDKSPLDTKDDDDKNLSQEIDKERFHWKAALVQSGIFLGFQHFSRLTQEKTTKELKGPFFRDWGNSVKNLRGWRDGDDSFTNYVAHPLQGSATGRIFVNNSDAAKKQEFGASKKYWESRFKAMLWSAAWSTQFELGPISEATIGNVGLKTKNGYSTMAYVDLVVTPTLGTGVLIGEDAIDKYFLKNWLERKSSNKIMIRLVRSLATPTTSFANLLRGKPPWRRDTRTL